MRALALAGLLLAPPADASPLCDLVDQVVDSGLSAPMFETVSTSEHGMPAGKLVPEGWVRCTIARTDATTGRYLCYGPAGYPQATTLAHLVSVNAELARCTGIEGRVPEAGAVNDSQRDFPMLHGSILVTIATYIDDGDIRMRIDFTHPA